MKRPNIYLSTCIALTISSSAIPQTPPDNGDALPPVSVIGTPLDPIPVPTSRAPDHDPNYWWRQSQEPGSGNDPGYVTPAPWDNPPESPLCALLTAQGFPEGCTRQYVQSGPPQISHISDPWQFDHLGSHGQNSSVLRYFFDISLVSLRNCYSDIANDPAYCESRYSSTIRNICNIYARPYYGASNSVTDRELCNEGADNIDFRMATIVSTRTPSFWYRYFEDNQLGIIRAFYVAVDLLTPFIPLDQYNELLVEARKFSNCVTVLNAWDSQNCGPNLPS